VPYRDRQHAPTGDPRGEYVLGRHHLQGAAASQPGEPGHGGDPDRDHRGQRARAVHRTEHDREQQRGEGKREVDAAHHERRQPRASHRRADTERDPRQRSDPDRDHADEQCRARSDHELREHVASEPVGAQPVLGTRRQQAFGGVDLQWVVRRPGERHQRGHDHHSDQDQPDHQRRRDLASAAALPGLPRLGLLRAAHHDLRSRGSMAT
jgi:hypothetical protein